MKTELYSWHLKRGGRMVDFAGWELPVFYETGAVTEHHATRSSVGLFDIDHMGQFEIAGPDALRCVDNLVTSDISQVAANAARYGLLCREDGAILDDVIVYRLADDRFMVVVNAANRSKDFDHIASTVTDFDCELVDRSTELQMIAVQGPNAVQLVGLASGKDLQSMDRFSSASIELFGAQAIVGRTGYTGEDGVELFVDGSIVDVWSGLFTLGDEQNIDVLPVGLSARDSLRFEPGYPLYGHEINEEITPFEARLGWAVQLGGDDFVGKEALVAQKAQPLTKKLSTIKMVDRGVARDGDEVLSVDGDLLGHVVSGMYAPTADAFAANVFLPPELSKAGSSVIVRMRGRDKRAEVVERPLYSTL